MTLTRIQIRRDIAANWTMANPVLSSGEYGVETNTGRFKIGDGATAWNALTYQGVYAINGTRAAPNTVTAVGGITPLGVPRELQFIKGSPANVVITANPQIAAGTVVGQELVLQGRDDTAKVTIQNGTGLDLNGTCVLGNGARIYLVWDGTLWGEIARNDV